MPTDIKVRIEPRVIIPTITAGLYAANDAVGGKMEFLEAVRWDSSGLGPASAIVNSVKIVDKAAQASPIDLYLFNSDFTAPGDLNPWVLVDADTSKVALGGGIIRILAADYIPGGGNSVADVGNINLAIKLLGTSLFVQAVVRGAPTYTDTDDIEIYLTLAQD